MILLEHVSLIYIWENLSSFKHNSLTIITLVNWEWKTVVRNYNFNALNIRSFVYSSKYIYALGLINDVKIWRRQTWQSIYYSCFTDTVKWHHRRLSNTPINTHNREIVTIILTKAGFDVIVKDNIYSSLLAVSKWIPYSPIKYLFKLSCGKKKQKKKTTTIPPK